MSVCAKKDDISFGREVHPIKLADDCSFDELAHVTTKGGYITNSFTLVTTLQSLLPPQQHPVHSMEVFKSAISGFGVRCNQVLKKDTHICDFVGEYVLLEWYTEFYRDNPLQASHVRVERPLQGKENAGTHKDTISTIIIDGSRWFNVSRFFNSSCTPNMEQRIVETENGAVRVSFHAVRDIECGEELTWNYFVDINTTCCCGHTSCRSSTTTKPSSKTETQQPGEEDEQNTIGAEMQPAEGTTLTALPEPLPLPPTDNQQADTNLLPNAEEINPKGNEETDTKVGLVKQEQTDNSSSANGTSVVPPDSVTIKRKCLWCNRDVSTDSSTNTADNTPCGSCKNRLQSVHSENVKSACWESSSEASKYTAEYLQSVVPELVGLSLYKPLPNECPSHIWEGDVIQFGGQGTQGETLWLVKFGQAPQSLDWNIDIAKPQTIKSADIRLCRESQTKKYTTLFKRIQQETEEFKNQRVLCQARDFGHCQKWNLGINNLADKLKKKTGKALKSLSERKQKYAKRRRYERTMLVEAVVVSCAGYNKKHDDTCWVCTLYNVENSKKVILPGCTVRQGRKCCDQFYQRAQDLIGQTVKKEFVDCGLMEGECKAYSGIRDGVPCCEVWYKDGQFEDMDVVNIEQGVFLGDTVLTESGVHPWWEEIALGNAVNITVSKKEMKPEKSESKPMAKPQLITPKKVKDKEPNTPNTASSVKSVNSQPKPKKAAVTGPKGNQQSNNSTVPLPKKKLNKDPAKASNTTLLLARRDSSSSSSDSDSSSSSSLSSEEGDDDVVITKVKPAKKKKGSPQMDAEEQTVKKQKVEPVTTAVNNKNGSSSTTNLAKTRAGRGRGGRGGKLLATPTRGAPSKQPTTPTSKPSPATPDTLKRKAVQSSEENTPKSKNGNEDNNTDIPAMLGVSWEEAKERRNRRRRHGGQQDGALPGQHIDVQPVTPTSPASPAPGTPKTPKGKVAPKPKGKAASVGAAVKGQTPNVKDTKPDKPAAAASAIRLQDYHRIMKEAREKQKEQEAGQPRVRLTPVTTTAVNRFNLQKTSDVQGVTPSPEQLNSRSTTTQLPSSTSSRIQLPPKAEPANPPTPTTSTSVASSQSQPGTQGRNSAALSLLHRRTKKVSPEPQTPNSIAHLRTAPQSAQGSFANIEGLSGVEEQESMFPVDTAEGPDLLSFFEEEKPDGSKSLDEADTYPLPQSSIYAIPGEQYEEPAGGENYYGKSSTWPSSTTTTTQQQYAAAGFTQQQRPQQQPQLSDKVPRDTGPILELPAPNEVTRGGPILDRREDGGKKSTSRSRKKRKVSRSRPSHEKRESSSESPRSWARRSDPHALLRGSTAPRVSHRRILKDRRERQAQQKAKLAAVEKKRRARERVKTPPRKVPKLSSSSSSKVKAKLKRRVPSSSSSSTSSSSTSSSSSSTSTLHTTPVPPKHEVRTPTPKDEGSDRGRGFKGTPTTSFDSPQFGFDGARAAGWDEDNDEMVSRGRRERARRPSAWEERAIKEEIQQKVHDDEDTAHQLGKTNEEADQLLATKVSIGSNQLLEPVSTVPLLSDADFDSGDYDPFHPHHTPSGQRHGTNTSRDGMSDDGHRASPTSKTKGFSSDRCTTPPVYQQEDIPPGATPPIPTINRNRAPDHGYTAGRSTPDRRSSAGSGTGAGSHDQADRDRRSTSVNVAPRTPTPSPPPSSKDKEGTPPLPTEGELMNPFTSSRPSPEKSSSSQNRSPPPPFPGSANPRNPKLSGWDVRYDEQNTEFHNRRHFHRERDRDRRGSGGGGGVSGGPIGGGFNRSVREIPSPRINRNPPERSPSSGRGGGGPPGWIADRNSREWSGGRRGEFDGLRNEPFSPSSSNSAPPSGGGARFGNNNGNPSWVGHGPFSPSSRGGGGPWRGGFGRGGHHLPASGNPPNWGGPNLPGHGGPHHNNAPIYGRHMQHQPHSPAYR